MSELGRGYRSLESYPPELRPIIAALVEWEEDLSDGYLFYAPDYGVTDQDEIIKQTIERLTRIAREILTAVEAAQYWYCALSD